MLVLEGHARCAAGDLDFGTLGTRASVFDGPPAPGVLVAPGRPCRRRRRDRRARRRRRRRPGGAVRRDRQHRRRRRPRRGPRLGPDRAARPPPAAARCRGGPAHRVRGVHARRQLVELPAAQARHRGPAASSRASRSSTSTGSRGRRASPSSGSTPPDGSLDESLTPGDGDVVLVPAGYHPVGVPRRLRLLLPQRDGRPDPRLALHARPRPRVADGLEPGAPRRHRRRRRMTLIAVDSPLQRMVETTPTDYWNDSCAIAELDVRRRARRRRARPRTRSSSAR